MASHDEEGGFSRQRHMSVSQYADNVTGGGGAQYEAAAGQRRSSVAPAQFGGARASQASNVLNQKDETFRKMSVAVPNLVELTQDAKEAAEKERAMGFREGVRLYPKAMFFSFGLSLAVIMEGYGEYFGRSLPEKRSVLIQSRYCTPGQFLRNSPIRKEVRPPCRNQRWSPDLPSLP